QGVDGGQVGLVEGGQGGGGLLRGDQAVGDPLADGAHALPRLAPGGRRLGRRGPGGWGRRRRLGGGRLFLFQVLDHVFLGEDAAVAAGGGNLAGVEVVLGEELPGGRRRGHLLRGRRRSGLL